MMNKEIYEAHLVYKKHGLLTLPGVHKWPNIKGWQNLPIDFEPSKHSFKNAVNLCLPCEQNKIEVIDVDLKNDPKQTIVNDFLQILKYATDCYDDLVIVRTPSGGIHLPYKCVTTRGNQILAKSGQGKAILETRSNAGQIVCFPSPGYEMIQGSMLDLPKLSNDDISIMFEVAKELNRYTPKRSEKEGATQNARKKRIGPRSFKSEVIEYYNTNIDLLSLLQSHGFKFISEDSKFIKIQRPGKEHSKEHSGVIFKNSNMIFIHSTSCQIAQNKAISGFNLRMLLEAKDFRTLYSEILKEIQL